jgi:hypothetical protein
MKPLETLSDAEFSAVARRALQELGDAPAAWQRAAIALFPETPSPWATAAFSVLRTLQAVLSFDSWAQPALATGTRSTAADLRHLMYSAKGRGIDLRLASAGGAFALAGQVLGPDENGVVEFASDGPGSRQSHLARLDEMGEFRIEGLRRGTYTLTLRLGADEIVLPAIEVGEHRP